ncbi:uncharacterized protein haspin [Scleropages formosus]|uniref:uncharacterized protein haspin n=1 Tax=Scleropages formosus TaxID=113540 RepID=UPI0010FABEE4|nr:serine/threonine-protein kinase haspin [Scleropages formosus]
MTGDRVLRSCYRKPLLSSTPSLVPKPSFRRYEPSVSEISFSNDEGEDAFKSSMESDRSMIFPNSCELRGLVGNHLKLQKGISFRENLSLGEQSGELSACKRTAMAAQKNKELFSHTDCDTASANSGKTKGSQLFSSKDVSVELSRDCNFVSAKTCLDTLIPAVKDRCRTSNPVVHLQHSVISRDSVEQSDKKQDEEFFSFPDCEIICNDSQSGDKVHRNDRSLFYLGNIKKASQSQKSDHWFSERLGQTSASMDPEKYIATTDQSLQYEPECPREGILEATVNGVSRTHFLKADTQPLDDHSRDLFSVTSQMEHHDPGSQDNASLKNFSASSCISLQTESTEEVLKAKNISMQPTVSLKRLDLSEYIQGDRAPQPERDGSKQRKHRRTGGNNNCAVRRRLSTVFVSSAAGTSSFSSELVSPVVERTTGRLRVPEPPKDRPGTGRKACISGFSVSRWTQKNDQQRKTGGPTRSFIAKTGDSSLFDFHIGLNTQKYLDSMKNCLLSTADVLPATPTHKEPMNVSSFLTNFSPSCMTTHTWRKLKAALSVHKKKKAFMTPRKLRLSHNLSSEVGLVDTNRELTASPPCTPFLQCMMSRLPMSTAGTPLGLCSYAEDISDAEKVYHECQQEGPITFEQCIPLDKMKFCKKIGEGTFGEVFSTVNDSMETVALKIIPIEGDQKVNGEDQKTFGEILHEIIISKELSSLGARENNRTQGFIALNNLHCVQGSYPNLLLAAWDKFDKQRMSENDRPDFFPDDQLFLILEFEFGGCDLENLNCKLSSLAQAKSILHQVTIALAVAEQALCFEHRDLHWGNILVKNTTEKKGTYILNRVPHNFETNGVLVNIIDYSLSRLEIDGLTVSCDISADEELFMGQGDYQFDIYRKMREENNNSWSEYNPHTNVLWLHYLADKLLHMNYKSKSLSKPMKVLKKNMTNFYHEVLGFKCAASVLEGSSLFK